MSSQTVYVSLNNKSIQHFLIQYLEYHDMFTVACEDVYQLLDRLQSMTPNFLFFQLSELELDYQDIWEKITSGHYARSMKIILIAEFNAPLPDQFGDYVDHVLCTPLDVEYLHRIISPEDLPPLPKIGLWV